MATIEYVALFVVVSLALAVGGAVVDAPVLPRAVAGQIKHAYCLVANGDCSGPGGPRPCVVGSRSRAVRLEVSILVVRLRDGRRVVRQRLSDGTERITVEADGGLAAGVRVGARLGGRGIEADASAGVDVGTERTFVVADARAGDRLVRRLDDEAPVAGATIGDLTRFAQGRHGDEAAWGISVSARGEVDAGLKALGIDVGGLRGITAGLRVDRRAGTRSAVLRVPREILAALSTPVISFDAAGAELLEAELVFGQGGAQALVLRASGAGAGKRGMRVESEARIDLADPEARELAGRLAGGDLDAVGALGRRLADRARIDVRRYATTRASKEQGGRLMGLGGTRTTVEESAALVSAQGREPGGRWGPNLECKHAA